jgi:hypothetical protein
LNQQLPEGAEIKIPGVGSTPIAVSTQLPAAVAQLNQKGQLIEISYRPFLLQCINQIKVMIYVKKRLTNKKFYTRGHLFLLFHIYI